MSISGTADEDHFSGKITEGTKEEVKCVFVCVCMWFCLCFILIFKFEG